MTILLRREKNIRNFVSVIIKWKLPTGQSRQKKKKKEP
jgi:hypothetical protein